MKPYVYFCKVVAGGNVLTHTEILHARFAEVLNIAEGIVLDAPKSGRL